MNKPFEPTGDKHDKIEGDCATKTVQKLTQTHLILQLF